MTHQKTVCVLGMHRSGTSVVSRMVELLGAYLGPEDHGMPPRSDNPKGFWEHLVLVRINDEILGRFGGNWHEPPLFPDGWERSSDLADLRRRAEDVIREDFGRATLWSWKDPRACLTLPFWQQLIPSMHYVVCLRNPVDVARSLEHRDGFTIEKGGELWLAYTTSALRSTSGHSRLLIFYDEVMRDPEHELRRLGEFVGTPALADQSNASREIQEFLEDSLHHHRTSVSQNINDPALVFPAKSLYLALRSHHARSLNHGTRSDLDAALEQFSERAHEFQLAQKQAGQVVDTLKAEFSESLAERERLVTDRDRLARSNAELTRALERLEIDRDRLARSNAELTRALAEHERLVMDRDRLSLSNAELTHALQQRDVHIRGLSTALGERDDRISDAQSQLSQSRALVQRMQRSLSWQVTAPLRFVVVRLPLVRRLLVRAHRINAQFWAKRSAAYKHVARSGLFDRAYYLQQSPDVAASGMNALAHYIAFGGREGRDPHPLFDTDWYVSRNPDVAASGINAFFHYIAFGGRERRDPHPLFDTDWYLRRNPDVATSGLNPLVHYASDGATEGRDPHPLFDTDWYLRQNPDVAASGMNPLVHYVRSGAAEGRDPHPLFDGRWYLQKYSDVVAASRNPLVHFLSDGVMEGTDPNPLFETKWYLETYPDVRQTGLNPLVHFVERGSLERRNPSMRFSSRLYLEANPDVASLGMCPLEHYLRAGINERRPLRREGRPLDTAIPFIDTKRVVMIDTIYPRPDRDAGSLFATNIVTAIQRLGYAVSFVATSEFTKESPYKHVLSRMGVEVVDSDAWPSVEDFIRAEGYKASVFFLSRVYAGGNYFEEVRSHAPSGKIIFNTVDLHYIREQREAILRNDRRALNLAMRTREREVYIARLADATVVVTRNEAEALREAAPGANVFELPLIYEFHGRDREFEERNGIGFVGGFLHPPNPDAVQYFLSEIWPLIRKKKPQLTFHVIGPDIPSEVATRSDPGLVVVGYVADLASVLARLRLTVAPLRYGAGAKGKLVSSLGHGVPSVATPVATEGLGLVDGETILVGRSPQEFADQVLRLYDDERLWYGLSNNGLELFRKEYSFEAGAQRVADLLSSIGLPANRMAATVDLAAR